MFKSWFYWHGEVNISLWSERRHLSFCFLTGLLDQEVWPLTHWGLSHYILNSTVTVVVKQTKVLLWDSNLRIKTSSWVLSLYYCLCLESEQPECAISLDCVVVYFCILLFVSIQIFQDIIVKIITKKLGEKYHKKKAVVKVKYANVAFFRLFWDQITSQVLFSLCKLFSFKSTLTGAETLSSFCWDLFWAGSESLNWFNVTYSVILS